MFLKKVNGKKLQIEMKVFENQPGSFELILLRI
jgi:hypothetical protein